MYPNTPHQTSSIFLFLSKDKLPWSGKRTELKTETKRVNGDMEIDGNLKGNAVSASGQLSAKGISSATITSPTSQGSLPYLLSGVNCKWNGAKFENCGQNGAINGTTSALTNGDFLGGYASHWP